MKFLTNPKVFALLALLLLGSAYGWKWSQPTAKELRRDEGKAAVRLMKAEPGAGFTEEDFRRHLVGLKKKLPSKDFSVVIQPPFVVIGDEPEPVVRQRARDTVKWTVDRLKQDYFQRDPSHILNIWLFKNTASYEKHARDLFGNKPDTPFGYYSPAHKALVMNIETGAGTLVHELVHPYMEANFPDCPPWFNEGLASLYEQSGEVDGRIYGFTNWRLKGLQQSIKAGAVPPFKTLMAMTSSDFYDQDKGTNYGQGRYLCYYLQEKNLLVAFYREFVANQKADPTGYRSLQKVLGESDMEAFQKRWEKYVLELSEDFALRPLPAR
jgi:hypothetical protein